MNTLSLFKPLFTSNLFDAFDDCISENCSTERAYSPRVDVRESKDAYLFDVELPGMSHENVDISIKDRILTINSRAEEKLEKADKDNKEVAKDDEKTRKGGERWLVRERRMTEFTRSFSLPKDADENKVEANFNNGLLSVIIKRAEESQPKTIKITAK